MRFAWSPRVAWLQSWRWRTRVWLARGEAALVALDEWLATVAPAGKCVASLPPQVLHAMATRAHLLAELGQWVEAETQLHALIAHQPKHAAHWFNLGYVRGRMDCPAAAQSAFERALALAPAMDAAWFGLGLALCDQACWLQAEAAWCQQVALQPWCPDGLEQLVRLHHRCGEVGRAAQRLTELRQFDPRRAMALEPLLQGAALA